MHAVTNQPIASRLEKIRGHLKRGFWTYEPPTLPMHTENGLPYNLAAMDAQVRTQRDMRVARAKLYKQHVYTSEDKKEEEE